MSKQEFYTSILKNMNQCYHTGVENPVLTEMIGEYAVVVLKDNVGNHRAILMHNGESVSGCLFDHYGEARVRYTVPEYRGRRLSRELFAWLSWKMPKCNFRHSQNLTEAGMKSI